MDWLDPLDAAMTTAEVSNPLNIGAALILSPPANTGPGYVDGPHRDALAGREPLDPRLRRYPHRGVETGGIWVWRGADTVDLSQHCKRSTLPPQSVQRHVASGRAHILNMTLSQRWGRLFISIGYARPPRRAR